MVSPIHLQARIALPVAGLLWFACVAPVEQAGGSSETVNCMVRGILLAPGGQAPAGHAEICVRAASALADTTGALARAAAACRYTDDSGQYAIDTIDTGSYVILASDANGNMALIRPLDVRSADTSISLGPDTLKPAGTIKGSILLSEGGDPRKVLVLVYGVDRIARVEADGSFRIGNLAQGTYDLRFLPCMGEYGVYDTGAVALASADTTDVGVIRLPFLGIPAVQGLRMTYDTLPQVITLTWHSSDAPSVAGYSVYRNLDDSAYVKLNAVPTTDTSFTDTALTPGAGYAYAVLCVDSTGQEGAFGQSVSVTTFSLFVPTDTISPGNGTAPGQFGYLARVDVDTFGSIFITDTKNGRLQKFTPQGDVVFSVDTFGLPNALAVGKNGIVYVTDQWKRAVVSVDTTGRILGSWPTVGTPYGIAVDTVEVYVASDSGIEVFGVGGGTADVLRYGPRATPFKDVVPVSPGNLLVTDDENVYAVDKASGAFTIVHAITDRDNNQDPRVEHMTGNSYLLKTSSPESTACSMYVIDGLGDVFTTWGTFWRITDMCCVPGGIVSVTHTGDILFYDLARKF